MPKIGVCEYMGHRGPRIRGTQKYNLPDNPQVIDGIIYCMAGCEGNKWDNINGYDGAGISISILQHTTKSNHVARILERYKKNHFNAYINEPFVILMINQGVDIYEGKFVRFGSTKELTKEENVEKFCPMDRSKSKKAEKKSKEIALAAWEMCRNELFQDALEEHIEWQIGKYMGYKTEVPYGAGGKRNWQVSEGLGITWNYINKFLSENLQKNFEDAKLAMFYFGMNINAPAMAKKYLGECIKELGYMNVGQVDNKKVFEMLVDKCMRSDYGMWGINATKRSRKPRTEKVLDTIERLKGEL